MPVPDRTHLEATAFQVTFVGKLAVILLACLSPFPPTDRSEPDRLFRLGIAGLDGWQSQCQTRGLVLAAKHETGETPTRLFRRERLSDLWTGLYNHQPMQPLGYSRCPGNRDNLEPLIPGESDFVLCTKVQKPPGSHWHCVSLILSQSTESP